MFLGDKLVRILRLLCPPFSVWLIFAFTYWVYAFAPFLEPAKVGSAPVELGSSQDPTPADPPTPFRPIQPTNNHERLSVISERPLFSETRRHPPPEVEEILEDFTEPVIEEPIFEEPEPEPPAPPPPAPKFSVRGFIVSDGETRVLIFESFNQREEWVSEGDFIQDWQITEINARNLYFKQNGFDHIVDLGE